MQILSFGQIYAPHCEAVLLHLSKRQVPKLIAQDELHCLPCGEVQIVLRRHLVHELPECLALPLRRPVPRRVPGQLLSRDGHFLRAVRLYVQLVQRANLD